VQPDGTRNTLFITHGKATHTSLGVPLLREASRSGRWFSAAITLPSTRKK
jgi:hypothetical protein